VCLGTIVVVDQIAVTTEATKIDLEVPEVPEVATGEEGLKTDNVTNTVFQQVSTREEISITIIAAIKFLCCSLVGTQRK